MGQLKAKQIYKIQSAWVKVTGQAVGSGAASVVVTAALTSVLAIAGEGDIAVPLKTSTGSAINGVAVTAPANRVEIWDNVSKDKITFVDEEVFGRLTVAGSVYTLSFFTLANDGTETTYTFSGATSIDFDFVYRFRFHELPSDAAVSMTTKNVHQDSKGASSVEVNEKLTVTSVNVLSNLSNIPASAQRVKLFVNGKEETPLGGAPAFTVTGTSIAWSETNGGYPLETSDDVVAVYYI